MEKSPHSKPKKPTPKPAVKPTSTSSKKAAPKALKPAVAPNEATSPVKKRATRQKFQFEVCLSFAGEDRARVEKINTRLKAKGISTFYDKDYQADLWGKNLYQHLADIYANKARFCVIFVSKHYIRKAWTKHELQSAQSRAFLSDSEYLLYVRLDETEVPGLLPITGIIRIADEGGVIGVTKLIEQKVLDARPASKKKKVTNPTTKLKKPSHVRKKILDDPTKFSCTSRVAASNDWILLDGHFYKGKVFWKDGKYTLKITPDAEQEARLNALNPRTPGFPTHQRVSFAHRNSGTWCHVEDITSASSGRAIAFEVVLSPQASSSTGAVWSAENALTQIEDALLTPEQEGNSTRNRNFYARTQESKVFPSLWQRLQGRQLSQTDVLRCARLEAVFHLLSKGLVQQVNDLSLGPASKGFFKVKFRGQFSSSYSYSGQTSQPLLVEGKSGFASEM